MDDDRPRSVAGFGFLKHIPGHLGSIGEKERDALSQLVADLGSVVGPGKAIRAPSRKTDSVDRQNTWSTQPRGSKGFPHRILPRDVDEDRVQFRRVL